MLLHDHKNDKSIVVVIFVTISHLLVAESLHSIIKMMYLNLQNLSFVSCKNPSNSNDAFRNEK
ncbi:predicted protein [Arabidopsis lyrata subsp. lyrata]|uniref:Predicted protein n=1 Tax=Arabidopsis lyrata subsp. lyrata TaxID=81972 RepID=D7LI73_ARALL|nr:predicted protein [Arabidopsis lyrata subsp. lyrata]